MNAADFAARSCEDLRGLGVRQGGLLLVHSSLSSMGRVPGGPETVIRGLLAAIGDEGTLLLPALTYESVTPQNPVFDLRSTPSCVGIIPEHFRTRDGTLRSMHPTHSVCAVGPRAGEILGAHQDDNTPCGPNSPFRRLRDFVGQILMLGCGLKPNTSMHGVEELFVPEFLYDPPVTYSLTDGEGVRRQKEYLPHGFHGWEQRYDLIAPLMAQPALVRGTVAGAECHLIDAREFWRAAGEKLAADPLYFVERAENPGNMH